jgi:hypothetical protein
MLLFKYYFLPGTFIFGFRLVISNAISNNILIIFWRYALVVDDTGTPRRKPLSLSKIFRPERSYQLALSVVDLGLNARSCQIKDYTFVSCCLSRIIHK